MSQTAHTGGHATHEKKDVSFPPIVLTSFVLLAVVLLAFVTMWWLLTYVTDQKMRADAAAVYYVADEPRRSEPPEPRLRANPLLDIVELRAAEQAILHTYGWVDREAGVVRIPIERALELTAERGLPVREAE